VFGSISKMRGRSSTATLNVYYPFHKLNSERQIRKNVGYPVQPSEPQREQQMAQKLAFRPFRAIQYRILRRSEIRRTFLFAVQAGSSLVRSLLASLTLLAVAVAVPVAEAQKAQMSVDVSKAGARLTATSSANSPNTSATVYTKESGSARTPKFRTRVESAMMLSLRSKR
jgi:hypothetical protein